MTQERNLWLRLAPIYKVFDGVIQRIESATTAAGIPDVYFVAQGVQGWVELKARKSFPIQERTIVRLPTYTEHQRRWLARAWNQGAHVLVAVDIAGESYWFEGAQAVVVGTRWDTADFVDNAYGIGDGTLDKYIKEHRA